MITIATRLLNKNRNQKNVSGNDLDLNRFHLQALGFDVITDTARIQGYKALQSTQTK